MRIFTRARSGVFTAVTCGALTAFAAVALAHEWNGPLPSQPVGPPTTITEQPLASPTDYSDPAWPDVTSPPGINVRCIPAVLAPSSGDGTPRVASVVLCAATSAGATAAGTAYVCPAFQGFLYDKGTSVEAYCASGSLPCVREAKVVVLPAYPYEANSKNASVASRDRNTGLFCVTVSCTYTQVATPTQSQKYYYYDCKT